MILVRHTATINSIFVELTIVTDGNDVLTMEVSVDGMYTAIKYRLPCGIDSTTLWSVSYDGVPTGYSLVHHTGPRLLPYWVEVIG